MRAVKWFYLICIGLLVALQGNSIWAETSSNIPVAIGYIDADGNTSIEYYETELTPPSVEQRAATSTADEDACIAFMNVERAKYGVPPFVKNQLLTDAARGHSTDMATNNFFDHDGSNGSKFWQRIANAGFQCIKCGENIAAGYGSAQATVDGWMASTQGHREAILNPDYWEVGVGYAYDASSNFGDYWTADFGTSSTSPTPGPVPGPGPAPTPGPGGTAYIDLTPNKYSFSTTDYISVSANVQAITTPFYPYVRIIMPSGTALYYVSGLGFTTVPTPYLYGGPFVLRNGLNGYPVLSASYSIVQTGQFTLEGYPTDSGGSLIGAVDQETLTVQ